MIGLQLWKYVAIRIKFKNSKKIKMTENIEEPAEEHSPEFINYLHDLKNRIHDWFAEIEAMQICHQDEEKHLTLLKQIQTILKES